ncbi:VOC family protein [Arthrobacter sp. TWP1-1]|uniref:VOC family protein n=1 Tax=Arthrobacter sp. TWP1-1 TaxID=2804568 RepID=UPI003CEB9C6B
MTNSAITLGAINMEAADPLGLADFWAAVTGSAQSVNGDSVYLAPSGPAGFGMFFQRGSVPRGEHQAAHLDLTVPWGSRQNEVERIMGLGAIFKWDVLEEFAHVQWTTLADPEGNLFCIAEHPPA